MTMDETALKARLAGIKDGGYAELATADLDSLVDAMIRHIGSTDPELRDDLIYEAFAEIILHRGADAGLVVRILDACLGKLTEGLDEDRPDGVFGRSFSMLVVALVLERDREAPFLGRERITEAFRRICDAYRRETNLVGYYPDKGWAHTVAHTADALAIIVRSEALGDGDAAQVLDLIRGKFLQPRYCFIDGEDERTARVIEAILLARPSMQGPVMEWVTSLAQFRLSETMPARFIVKGNVRNLLRSVYFISDRNEALRRLIEESLAKIGFS